MIVTVTMNPSVDISYPLETLNIDEVNRLDNVSKTAGGKGLNVSRVIKQMDGKLIASGILGGHLGNFIVDQLEKENVPNNFLKINKESRNCIAILHEGNQTEILESGPVLDDGEGAEYLKLFEELLEKSQVITMSGSLPKGLSTDYYQKLLEVARNKDVKILVDTSGKALKEALLGKEKPYLIKPNTTELNDLLEEEVTSDIPTLKKALSNELFEGVEAIVVSLGADGAFAKFGKEFYKATIPVINVTNPVGSGDATVAGLAVALDRESSWEEVLKTAMTTGMLNTMESKTGHIDISKFEEYYNQITIEKISY